MHAERLRTQRGRGRQIEWLYNGSSWRMSDRTFSSLILRGDAVKQGSVVERLAFVQPGCARCSVEQRRRQRRHLEVVGFSVAVVARLVRGAASEARICAACTAIACTGPVRCRWLPGRGVRERYSSVMAAAIEPYLVRHVVASARGLKCRSDRRSPLIELGLSRFMRVVDGPKALAVKIALVLTSFLRRAAETAGLPARGTVEFEKGPACLGFDGATPAAPATLGWIVPPRASRAIGR